MLKLSKTTSPQNLFQSDCNILYNNLLIFFRVKQELLADKFAADLAMFGYSLEDDF